MGYSKEHASNAGLLLTPTTGYTSIQYHVLYDDQFMSVAGVDEDQRRGTLNSVNWPSLIQSQGGSDIHYDDEDIYFVPNELSDEWLTPEEILAKQALRRRQQHHQVNMRQGSPTGQSSILTTAMKKLSPLTSLATMVTMMIMMLA